MIIIVKSVEATHKKMILLVFLAFSGLRYTYISINANYFYIKLNV